MAKDKKSKKSSKSKKSNVDENQPNAIKEKPYITKQIDTSITLLESPEDNLVLEALLFLSKFVDIERNNLLYVSAHGLLPKVLAVLDRNICILRVALRLLSQLLTVEIVQVELNKEEFDEAVMKICRFYIKPNDVNIKEFSIMILAIYSTMGKTNILLAEPDLITALLKTIKDPDNVNILKQSLELLNKFVELEEVRQRLPKEKDFNPAVFINWVETLEDCILVILTIFEKITYFCEDPLMQRLKDSSLVEHLFSLIIINPERKPYVPLGLNIITHCMNSKITNTYFVASLEFLQFCQWTKTCWDEVMHPSINILLELSKIEAIRQMLFDLSIEDTILAFFRSADKKVLNTTCEAVAFMSKHKYCCEKILTPNVVKKILEIMQRTGDKEDTENEIALSTLHYFARRDSKTIYMIHTYDGIKVIVNFMKKGTGALSVQSYGKVLEIVNMFVSSNQLQSLVFSPELYEIILAQTLSEFDEICMRSLEIMINCLNHKDFQNYFLLNKGSQVVVEKLGNTNNEHIIRLLTIFVHNSLMREDLLKDFIHRRILLILKDIPEHYKLRNPLIPRTINLIYDMCLPIKFFETGRLELTDRLKERFYIINGPWNEPFPFLEVLQLRSLSTLTTIYIVDHCVPLISDDGSDSIHSSSISTVCSSQSKSSINYGYLSPDPFLPKYVEDVKKLLSSLVSLGVTKTEAKIKAVAEYVNKSLCGPEQDPTIVDKLHTFRLHIECIKHKLGTNMIPIGYLRLGFHCERALLFKALADHVYIPVTLVKGKKKLYWNEVALIRKQKGKHVLKMFVVDLMHHIGHLLPIGSRECNVYCDIQ